MRANGSKLHWLNQTLTEHALEVLGDESIATVTLHVFFSHESKLLVLRKHSPGDLPSTTFVIPQERQSLHKARKEGLLDDILDVQSKFEALVLEDHSPDDPDWTLPSTTVVVPCCPEEREFLHDGRRQGLLDDHLFIMNRVKYLLKSAIVEKIITGLEILNSVYDVPIQAVADAKEQVTPALARAVLSDEALHTGCKEPAVNIPGFRAVDLENKNNPNWCSECNNYIDDHLGTCSRGPILGGGYRVPLAVVPGSPKNRDLDDEGVSTISILVPQKSLTLAVVVAVEAFDGSKLEKGKPFGLDKMKPQEWEDYDFLDEDKAENVWGSRSSENFVEAKRLERVVPEGFVKMVFERVRDMMGCG